MKYYPCCGERWSLPQLGCPLCGGPLGEDRWKPDYAKAPRRIVCAAMMKEGRIVTGARHYDLLMKSQMDAAEGIDWWLGCKQGFVDQFGDFLNREEAWVVAKEQNQIIREVSTPGRLYSENLY